MCVYIYLSFPKRFNSIRFISNIPNLHIHDIQMCMCLWFAQFYGPIILSYFHMSLSNRMEFISVLIFCVIVFFCILLFSWLCYSSHEIYLTYIQTRQCNNVQQKYFVVFFFSKKNISFPLKEFHFVRRKVVLCLNEIRLLVLMGKVVFSHISNICVYFFEPQMKLTLCFYTITHS